MNSYSDRFGLIVAYLLPGFVGLAGLATIFPSIARWLQPVDQGQFGFGPTVYALLGATTIGMTVSGVRWLVIDQLHRFFGVTPPVWEDRFLDQNLAAFSYIVEAHYRYYQFYSNTLIAVLCAYAIARWSGHIRSLNFGTDIGLIVLCTVLFAGSRDALAKYYRRTTRLIGTVAHSVTPGDPMTNGNHQAQESGSDSAATITNDPRRRRKRPPTRKHLKQRRHREPSGEGWSESANSGSLWWIEPGLRISRRRFASAL